MIAVTGGAGFIGSNLVQGLNRKGHTSVLVVDNLTRGEKFRNLIGCSIADYCDKGDFLEHLQRGDYGRLDALFHCGACTSTTEWDGRYLMNNNYAYSKVLLHYCLEHRVPFLYASSAAVYGQSRDFQEAQVGLRPVNVYGYSKLLFDEHVCRRLPGRRSQVVGFRYFNVYGSGEAHKGPMASLVHRLNGQLLADGCVRLFGASHGHMAGEQRRDFVHIDDVVAVNLWFWEHPGVSGIFNVGTGVRRSCNELARAVLAWHGRGEIEYIAFPESLVPCYQSDTEADLGALRAAGYEGAFQPLELGVKAYLDRLNA